MFDQKLHSLCSGFGAGPGYAFGRDGLLCLVRTCTHSAAVLGVTPLLSGHMRSVRLVETVCYVSSETALTLQS